MESHLALLFRCRKCSPPMSVPVSDPLSLRLQVNSMRDTVRNVWCIFDDDGNGTIERSEFLAPHGLADTIIATLDYQ
eukprot:m.66419 g.66419  ORF g.66419 m.66419 type:complete len:77 (+) comp7623_c0_seq1:46-276(+)